MPNSVDVIFTSDELRIVAMIGKEAAVMVCCLITFSVVSTQMLKSMVMNLLYQRGIAMRVRLC